MKINWKKTGGVIICLILLSFLYWARGAMMGVNPGGSAKEQENHRQENERYKKFKGEKCLNLNENDCINKFWSSQK